MALHPNLALFTLQQIPAECPAECCPSTGELAPNPGFEQGFAQVGQDLIPIGWTGTNVNQETRQNFIHTGNNAALLGRQRNDDASLSALIINGVRGGCFYDVFYHLGGEGPADIEVELVALNLVGTETLIGRQEIIGQSKVSGVGLTYYFKSIQAPNDTVSLRLDFTKNGVGSADLDDVSVQIA